MSNWLKNKRIVTIVISAGLLIIGAIFAWINAKPFAHLLFILSCFTSGFEVFQGAIRQLSSKMVMGEEFLMSIAAIGAILIGEYIEAATVMILYSIGEYFQEKAVSHSRSSIQNLIDIVPEKAFVYENGTRIEKDADEILVGEILEIRTGEKFPVDAIVVEGSSTIDKSAITGESFPEYVKQGDYVYSGSINGFGRLLVRAVKLAEDSMANRILELIENATENKAKSERLISRFSKIYTPIVVCVALCIAVFPQFFVSGTSELEWIRRALSLLVVSCPCAFIISIPLAFFSGIGMCSKYGILVKSGEVMERLPKLEAIGFDKTGTLTTGIFELKKIKVLNDENDTKEENLLYLVSELERGSTHPIANAVTAYMQKQGLRDEFTEEKVVKLKNLSTRSGYGVCGEDENYFYYLGNLKLMEQCGVIIDTLNVETKEIGTIIYLARKLKRKENISEINTSQILGEFVFQDNLKESSKETINELSVKYKLNLTMITGDRKEVAEYYFSQLKLHDYLAEALPDQKLNWVKEMHDRGYSEVAFVGDGLNDAPVLASSDISFAMGGIGSDATIEVADIVLMKDDLSSIPTAIKIAKKTMSVVRENLFFSFFIKFLFLFLLIIGLMPMWLAVFADVGVTLIAVLNSLRIFSI